MAERGVPEALDVEHFAQARIQELEFLDAAVAAVSREAGVAGDGDGVGGHIEPSSTSAGGLRDQAQGVPRHMRRRTTSHKPRRMPAALKSKGDAGRRTAAAAAAASTSRTKIGGGGVSTKKQGDLEAGLEVDTLRCRKHRRRPRALLAMHSPHAEEMEEEGEDAVVAEEGAGKKNQGDAGVRAERQRAHPRWLETHIWHAKRMHMREAWGFVLPAESNRGPRAVMEAALKHCTLQDATFLRPLELRGPQRGILGVLSAVTDPLDTRATRQQSCLDGFVEARTHLYRVNEFPLGCIAPVSVLWSPSDAGDTSPASPPEASRGAGGEGSGENSREGERDDDDDDDDARRVWLWVHPAAAGEALREVRRACALEGGPWERSVQAGPVPGGLCRLRVRGGRSHEIVQQVLRTEPGAVAGRATAATSTAAGDHFEIAARDNATRWRALETAPGKSNGKGSGSSGAGKGGAPRRLPAGSVLAITALDPREHRRRRQQGWRATDRRALPPPPAAATAPTGAFPDTAQDTHAHDGSVIGGGGEKPGGSGGSGDKRISTAAEEEETAAAAEECPPRWAAVSPLWDPDARALAARLAATRPDHVINEGRRRERARGAWDDGAAGATGISAGQAAAKDDSGGGGSGGGAAPVILVSASGVTTTAHGEPAPTATTGRIFHGDRGGGGGSGGGGGGRNGGAREVDKKRRAIASGWDLILPPGWAPVFFSALVMAGARAISLKDADGLALEAGEPRFPADYPDTVAGRRHWDEIGRLSEETWTRTRPKHRGFKRHPPLPTAKASGSGKAAAAAAGHGNGGGNEGTESGQAQQSEPPTKAEPTVSSSPWLASQFRPDFRSLAGAAAIAAAAGAAAGAGGGPLTASTGGAGGDDPVLREARGQRREPYAVARGFHYVRAFLPEEKEEPDEDPGVVRTVGRMGSLLHPPPPPPPLPPLLLAFSTVVGLVITPDRGVPKPGAPIHPASAEHHALWMQGRRDGKPWSGFSPTNRPSPVLPPSPLSSSVGAGAGAGAAAIGVDEGGSGGASGGDETARGLWPTTALVTAAMGATTSGGFSFLLGGGAGRAVCEAVAVRDAFALSAACCRRQRGGGVGGWGPERPRRPWALVLVGNEAGGWVRPAVAYVEAS